MGAETEAWRIWMQLRPTLVDTVIILVMFASIWLIRYSMNRNRLERQDQIDEIKKLVLQNIADIKDSFAVHIETMKDVVEKLQHEKTMIQEHLVRHEKITDDINRICRVIDDHESRLRPIERWNGKERRKG